MSSTAASAESIRTQASAQSSTTRRPAKGACRRIADAGWLAEQRRRAAARAGDSRTRARWTLAPAGRAVQRGGPATGRSLREPVQQLEAARTPRTAKTGIPALLSSATSCRMVRGLTSRAAASWTPVTHPAARLEQVRDSDEAARAHDVRLARNHDTRCHVWAGILAWFALGGEMTMTAAGSGTEADPWVLTTPPGKSEFEAWRDEQSDPPSLVVQVGTTQLRYQLRCIDDLHAMLKDQGDWVPLGNADEQKAAAGRHGRGLGPLGRQPGRRLVRDEEGPARPVRHYVPPVLEVLGLAEVEHNARNNRMRAR